jgi:ABC-type lipoprotein export system ATPase subunit
MPFLSVQEVVKAYGSRAVLDGASFEAEPGDTVAVLGPSGSGKSTLLNIIGALDRPSSGSVTVGASELTTLAGTELARFRSTRVGFVFQDHHLLPQLTATENVLLPALAAGLRGREGEAARLLDRVGVGHRAAAFPWEMSGGERQRVAVARALVNVPPLLLCDEPTGNLDHATGAEVIDLLLGLASQPPLGAEHVTIVMVTHNLDHAARFGRRLSLADGRLREVRNGG